MGLINLAANYAASKIAQAAVKNSLIRNAIKVDSYEIAKTLKPGMIANIENNIGIVIACPATSLLMISPFQGNAFWGAEWREHLPYLNDSGNDFDIRTSAKSFVDGLENCRHIECALADKTHSFIFPAFEYCSNKEQGWYLPAIEELELFKLPSILEPINNTLSAYKADTIIPIQGNNMFWSSTDTDEMGEYNTSAFALSVSE